MKTKNKRVCNLYVTGKTGCTDLSVHGQHKFADRFTGFEQSVSLSGLFQGHCFGDNRLNVSPFIKGSDLIEIVLKPVGVFYAGSGYGIGQHRLVSESLQKRRHVYPESAMSILSPMTKRFHPPIIDKTTGAVQSAIRVEQMTAADRVADHIDSFGSVLSNDPAYRFLLIVDSDGSPLSHVVQFSGGCRRQNVAAGQKPQLYEGGAHSSGCAVYQ